MLIWSWFTAVHSYCTGLQAGLAASIVMCRFERLIVASYSVPACLLLHWLKRCLQEAGGEFNFPETITSLSYQLRSIYQRLLWDYEQMYFWRNTGPRMPAVTASAAPKSEAIEARCVSSPFHSA